MRRKNNKLSDLIIFLIQIFFHFFYFIPEISGKTKEIIRKLYGNFFFFHNFENQTNKQNRQTNKQIN